MNIGICSPINPASLEEFLDKTERIPDINGGATSVNTYVKELLRNDHQVVAFTCAVPSDRTTDYVLRGKNIEIHVIHSNPGVFLSHAFSRLYMVNRLKSYISQYIDKLDVLHAQWTYDFALAAKSFEDRIPVFCTVRDWSPFILSMQSGLKKIQWHFYNMLTHKVLASDKIQFIANSSYTRNQILAAYPQKDVPIIFNPIDKELILEDIKPKTNYPSFISIATSISDKRKNVITLLKAFSKFRVKHSEASLRLVGGGFTESNRDFIECREKGLLDGVILCGYKKHRDLIKEIDGVNCLVHPSLEETFGNILIEGMSRGKLVIGGEKSGAVPQVLGNGKYGILCDVTNVDDLVKAMEKSLERDCDRICKDALSYTRDNYSSYAVMIKHLELYGKFYNNRC